MEKKGRTSTKKKYSKLLCIKYIKINQIRIYFWSETRTVLENKCIYLKLTDECLKRECHLGVLDGTRRDTVSQRSANSSDLTIYKGKRGMPGIYTARWSILRMIPTRNSTLRHGSNDLTGATISKKLAN